MQVDRLDSRCKCDSNVDGIAVQTGIRRRNSEAFRVKATESPVPVRANTLESVDTCAERNGRSAFKITSNQRSVTMSRYNLFGIRLCRPEEV